MSEKQRSRVILAPDDPTDAMIEAGCAAMFGAGSKPDCGWPEYVKQASRDNYIAMIGAIERWSDD